MSRSYKKFSIVRQETEDYRYLNRRLRHDKLAEIPKGGSYRRFSVKSHEWAYRWSMEQAIQDWYEKTWIRERYSYDEWLNYWKSFLRK
jgi:hypothetical protein